jgi:hypothetical protein
VIRNHPAAVQGADNRGLAVHQPVSPPGLRSANGERRVESPCREGCRLPTVVRDERRPAPGVYEALLDADTFEDLSGKWQAAILTAERNRPDLRTVGSG